MKLVRIRLVGRLGLPVGRPCWRVLPPSTSLNAVQFRLEFLLSADAVATRGARWWGELQVPVETTSVTQAQRSQQQLSSLPATEDPLRHWTWLCAASSACEVGVVKWVRCFTMAEVLGRVQPPNVPNAAPRQVVGKPALGAHPRASVLSARGPRRTSQNGACTSPPKSHFPSSPQQRVPTTRPTNQIHTSTKHTTSA